MYFNNIFNIILFSHIFLIFVILSNNFYINEYYVNMLHSLTGSAIIAFFIYDQLK